MYGTATHLATAMPSSGADSSTALRNEATNNQLKIGSLRISNTTPRGFSAEMHSPNKKFGSVAAPKPKQKTCDAQPIADSSLLPHPPPYMSPPTQYKPSYTVSERVEDTDLLPPPPPELYSDVLECSGTDLPAPPSPVSSSYSELRRVNRDAPPPSLPQLHSTADPQVLGFKGSDRVYSGPTTTQQSALSLAGVGGVVSDPSTNQMTATAEFDSELDSMTKNLMARIEHPHDDIHGLCGKCGVHVKGEGGCTALGRVYHASCFCCSQCDTALANQRFYVVDSHAHCHDCYLSTLEKCCVCHEPITDRLLRATGKPYHPRCFVCVQCGKCLDGVSFTVDASNQTYCIEDFHQKFAPRCSKCSLPIIPRPGEDETVRVVALDRSFHVDCYCCEDCNLVLSSEAEGRGCFPLDGHVLCKSCNAARVRAVTSR